jgi:hypothetical protein
MKAIFDSRIFNIIEDGDDVVLEGSGGDKIAIDFGDERLIVDPTDSEVADASNLAEWYSAKGETLERLRSMLRGEISLAEWQLIRAQQD